MSAPTAAPASAAGAAGSDPAPPALEAHQLSASYGPYRALFDVSFDVPAGGITALIGSNGAGKSTVARVVTGLLPSTSGTIRLDGRDVTGLAAYKIARAGSAHVPEGRGVFARLTVEENLRLAFRQRGGRKSVASSMERAFDAFPVLSARRRQAGGTLSGGEQRILSLAKVLVAPPRVLVADEISLGLAPVMIDAVYEGLVKVNQAGTALLIVEQQVDRVLDIAHSAVVLEHGSVAYSGPADGALVAMESVLSNRAERAELLATGSPDGANLGWETTHVDHELRFRRRGRSKAGRGAAPDATRSAAPAPSVPPPPAAPPASERKEPE